MFSLFRKKSTIAEPPREQVEPAAARDWLDDLSVEERDRIIEKIASGIVSHKMETPAILFLEMHKPVAFFAGQSMIILSPFTAPFIGFENVQIATKLIENRESVEILIQRIEELAVARDVRSDAERKAAKAERAASRSKRKEQADVL